MDLGCFNSQRAQLLIQTLLEQGVFYFCIAPGSRNSPLAIALSTLPKEQVCVHFEERGLGFHALGYAKASRSPVALIVTSGTAVANLFPAIAEASSSRIPLIIITADRPPELRGCSANQTIDQVKIFGSFTRFDMDLPISDPLFSDEAFSSTLAHAVLKAKLPLPGPVHINCMIREPSFSFTPLQQQKSHSCYYEPLSYRPSEASLDTWARELSAIEKGIILLGSDALDDKVESLLYLASQLGWPIFSDIISGGRQIGQHPYHIQYPDLFLKACPDIEVNGILHIGDRLASKTITQWLQQQKEIPYFHISDHFSLYDPIRKITRKITSQTNDFCKAITARLSTSTSSSWISFWKQGEALILDELSLYFSKNLELSEPALAYAMQEACVIFLSNSMPVRDADLFLFSSKGTSYITSNRGVSGSDGNIATAIGVATALQKPLVAILGDLAVLHDMSSLSLWKNCPVPITFLVYNNQGGGIFSFLPVAENKEILEKFFAVSHAYSFENLAAMFSIPYHKVTSWEEWKKIQQEATHPTQTQFIECKTCRTKNVFHHEDLYEKIKGRLCSSLSLWETKNDLSLYSFTVS